MAEDPGAVLRDLHQPGEPFLLANAWDAGSARVLAGLGAEAIGTSSAAHAFTLGRVDGRVSRDEALSHAADLVAATPLPVSGDLENGYGPDPEDVAETVRGAAEAGLAGCSIEDTTAPDGDPFDREHAVERVKAGIAAARALSRDFVFVARADGVMIGAYDLEEALARIRAYAEAGADCVYVPMPGDRAALARVVEAAGGVPVNALAAGPLGALSRQDFAETGIARISLGSSLARMTQRTLIEAAKAMIDDDRFNSHRPASGDLVAELLAEGRRGG